MLDLVVEAKNKPIIDTHELAKLLGMRHQDVLRTVLPLLDEYPQLKTKTFGKTVNTSHFICYHLYPLTYLATLSKLQNQQAVDLSVQVNELIIKALAHTDLTLADILKDHAHGRNS